MPHYCKDLYTSCEGHAMIWYDMLWYDIDKK
jgi:hypothetical protein